MRYGRADAPKPAPASAGAAQFREVFPGEGARNAQKRADDASGNFAHQRRVENRSVQRNKQKHQLEDRKYADQKDDDRRPEPAHFHQNTHDQQDHSGQQIQDRDGLEHPDEVLRLAGVGVGKKIDSEVDQPDKNADRADEPCGTGEENDGGRSQIHAGAGGIIGLDSARVLNILRQTHGMPVDCRHIYYQDGSN